MDIIAARARMIDLKPVTRDDAIYLTDNGRALCGAHLGSSARYTGRDISGQEIMEVTPEIAAFNFAQGSDVISCEQCGMIASAIVVR